MAGWIDPMLHTGSDVGSMVLCKIVLRSSSLGEELFFNLRVNGDFSWVLLLLGKYINPDTSPYLQQFPQFASSVTDIENIVMKLDASKVCSGNRDLKFSALTQKNNGKFRNPAGKKLFSAAIIIVKLCTIIMIIGTEVVAAVDIAFDCTIRHVKCEMLISSDSPQQRCSVCETYRKSLHSMVSRQKAATPESNSKKLFHDSHVNYRYLSPAEKDIRMRNLHTAQRHTKMQLDRLSAKIRRAIQVEGVQVKGMTFMRF